MLSGYPASGMQNVLEYLISGLPWVTSSVLTSDAVTRFDFPYVTSFLCFSTTQPLRVGFTENGVNANPASNANYFIVFPNQLFSFNVRCKSVFLRRHTANNTEFSMLAGLTLIPHRNFPVLTGSAYYRANSPFRDLPVFGYGVENDIGFGTGLG